MGMIELSHLTGLWERSLIVWPEGREDKTTFVAWLQGPNFFADLRQPADPPSFEKVSCLDDIEPHHIEWLTRQEGFAGRLCRAESAFEWQRMIDYQCPSDAADAGYLNFSGNVLIERGRDTPYVEHWHRTPASIDPQFAIRMRDQRGIEGFLVRAGDIFMYARGRTISLPHGAALAWLAKSCSLAGARELVDCEISLGRIRGEAWKIDRSSLPFRVRADLSPSFATDGGSVSTTDLTPAGAPISRHWNIICQDAPGTIV